MQRATGGGEVAARAADQIGRSLHAGLHERTQGEDRVIRLRPGEAGQRSNAEEYIAMNPAALQVFCNATAKAQKMMHTDDSVFTQVAERYFPKFAPSVIASATKNFFGSHRAIPKNPTISDDEWTRVMALELGGGSIKSTLPYDRMVDNSFALEATKRFGIAW